MVNSEPQNHSSLSIVVPILNEASLVPELLAHLQSWQNRMCEIVLVDGGSCDGTLQVLRNSPFKVIESARGRAAQMNAGAACAAGDILIFLHADTRLPEGADSMVLGTLETGGRDWGRFDVRIIGESRLLPVVARMMNWRSRLTGISTGDQAIFVRRKLFEQIGGFPQQALMEDVELCKRLKKFSAPACLGECVVTAGRRWESRGVWRTIRLMWWLRFAYWLGADPEKLKY